MRGLLHPPFDVYVRTFFCPFSYLNKTLLYKSFWLIKPGPWSWRYIFRDHESNMVHHKLSICALPIWLRPGSYVFTFGFPWGSHWKVVAVWWLLEGRYSFLSQVSSGLAGSCWRAGITDDCAIRFLIGQEIFHFSPSCHCYSVVKSCLTLCEPRNYSTPGFPVLHSLPEFAQTHVHWVGDAIQTSYPLLPSFPPALFPSMSLFQWVGSSHQVAKVLELQLQHQSFQWIFRVDFL